MKSCKILRYGAVCGLAALAAVGCSVDDAETIRVRELTAAEHELFVPASGGTAEIQLYSNGRVRVEALNDIGGWASVDRTEFDGDRMVSVTFTENGSFRRMAKLRFVLDGGTRADTVCIKQYGVVPSLECPIRIPASHRGATKRCLNQSNRHIRYFCIFFSKCKIG